MALDRRFAMLAGALPAHIATFIQLNDNARAQAPVNPTAAAGYLAQAEALFRGYPDLASYSDQLDYTRRIVNGDPAALADHRASKDLVARGLVNSRPDSTLSAGWHGFKQGLDEGFKRLANLPLERFVWMAVGVAAGYAALTHVLPLLLAARRS